MNRRYGNSSSHMRSHMLALCVTIENYINPVSVLVFLHLVTWEHQGIIASFLLLMIWETNVLGLFVRRVHFQWVAALEGKVRSQPWRFQEVACISPSLLDDIFVSMLLRACCFTRNILLRFLFCCKCIWKRVFIQLRGTEAFIGITKSRCCIVKNVILVYTEQQEHYDL